MSAPHSSTTRSTFKRSVTVEMSIDGSASTVWSLLTDAERFSSWNSTVTSIEGPITLGTKLAITVPTSPRTFRPTVSAFTENETMTWSDGRAPMFKGVRVFTLTPEGDRTRFTMTETFSGLMLPMIGRTLPDFEPIFRDYAADLATAAANGTADAK